VRAKPKAAPKPKAPRIRRKKISRSPLEVVGEFAKKAARFRDKPVYVGIDPGMTGALAFACETAHCVVDIPMILTLKPKTRRTTYKQRLATGKKSKTVMSTDRAFDYDAILALFRLLKDVKHRVHVILEQIPPSLGKGRKYAEIMLNRAYMLWPLFLRSKRYECHEVKPGVWKEALGLLVRKERGMPQKQLRKLKAAAKTKSLTKARKLFPDAELPRVSDHDRAEALLLIHYLQRHKPKAAKSET
jgi:hypothetical protein